MASRFLEFCCARFAVDLLERLENTFADELLGRFATDIKGMVEEDRAVLERIIEKIDSEQSALKDAAAWMAEKASRFKLRLDEADDLGALEALETLSLGIMGKLALWRVLALIACADHRLRDIDYDSLIARAQSQFNQVEARRLEAAARALRRNS